MKYALHSHFQRFFKKTENRQSDVGRLALTMKLEPGLNALKLKSVNCDLKETTVSRRRFNHRGIFNIIATIVFQD